MRPIALRDALSACERDDPRGHAMHLAAAASWGFCQSIANTPEGIAWGVLLAVTVLRVPKIHAAFRPFIRDPAWILLTMWMIWMLSSVAWTHPDVDRLSSLRPIRWLITPLLLWPVMGYPWLLLGAIAAGAVVQAIAAIALSIGPDRLLTYSQLRSLTGFGQFQVVIGSLLAISIGACSSIPTSMRMSRLALLVTSAVSGLLLLLSAGRGSISAGLASVIALAMRPRRPKPARRLLAYLICIFALSCLAMIFGIGNRVVERIESEYLQVKSISSQDAASAIMRVGSHRGALWLAAWDLGQRHPFIGHGRHSFAPLIRDWAAEHASEHPEIAPGIARLSRVNHAHNTFLNIWVEGGAIGVMLFGIGLAILTRRIWLQSAHDPVSATAMALLMIVLVGTVVGMSELKAGGALIAIALAISMRPTPSGDSP